MPRQPKAEVEVTAQARGLGAQLKKINAQFVRAGKGFSEALFGKSATGGKKGATTSGVAGEFAGNLAARAASMATGFLVEQAKEVMTYNDQLTRLRILSGKSTEEIDAYSKSVRAASDATGISQLQVLEAGRAYVTLTGDMDTAQGKAREWAEVAQATESTAADIAATAAAMKQNLNIDPSDMKDAFGVLSQQGKAGAIELKDLAQQLSNIAPQWAMFKGGTGVEGLKQMGAALQIAKRGFGGDASETVTGVQSLLTSLVKHSDRFKKGGVKVFDVDKNGKKTMRSVFDIIDDIGKSKLMKSPKRLIDAFGRVEAYRAFIQLKNNNAELKKMAENAGSAADIERDFAAYMNSDAGKAKKQWADITNSIKEAFTPERLAVFVTAVQGLAKGLGAIVGGVGTILEGVKGLAEGAASVFGGQSEEDRIAIMQAKRLDERETWAARFFEQKNPDGNVAEQFRFMKNTILEEEVLKANLADQGAGKKIYRPQFDKKKNFLGDKGDYSISELKSLRSKTQTNTSDPAVFASMIDQLLAKQGPMMVQWIRQAAQDAVDKGVTVQVGADSVAKAAAHAPSRRRRPGG